MKEYSYGICPYKIENSKVQILLIQPKGHTEWGFIKGKIDVGETKEECAIRECLEETNISSNETVVVRLVFLQEMTILFSSVPYFVNAEGWSMGSIHLT